MDRPLELVYKRGGITQKTSSVSLLCFIAIQFILNIILLDKTFSVYLILILQTDGLTIILKSDWVLFCEEWSVPESKGISCEIVFTSPSQDENNNNNNINKEKPSVGPCEDEPISVEDTDNMDEPNNNLVVRRPYIKTQPEVHIFYPYSVCDSFFLFFNCSSEYLL